MLPPPQESRACSNKGIKEQRGERDPITITRLRHICNKCPARRDKADLRIIHDYVSNHTEMGTTEPLWVFLPWPLQMELCRHVRYIHYDTDTLEYLRLCCSSSSSSPWEYPYPKAVTEATKYLVLMQGDAELTCGEETRQLSLRNGNGISGRRGNRGYSTRNPSFGSIQIPSSIIKLICQMTSKKKETSGEHPSWIPVSESYAFIQRVKDACSSNVQASDRPLRACVLFYKGCHCLSINNSDLRFFMERLFDHLLSQCILNHLRVDIDQMKERTLMTFPAGSPIMIEGVHSNKIVLTLRGRIKLLKKIDQVDFMANDDSNKSEAGNDTEKNISNATSPSTPEESATSPSSNKIPWLDENDQMDIAFGAPMTFVGHIPYFIKPRLDPKAMEEGQINTPESLMLQPLSVVAVTSVRALVLDAEDFLQCLRKPVETGIDTDTSCDHGLILNAFEITTRRQWKWIKCALPRKMLKLLWDANKDDEVAPFPTASMIKLEELIQELLNGKQKPRLNKKKILCEFKRLIDGDKVPEENDLFHPTKFSDLEKAIEMDWDGKEDCNEKDELRPYPTMIFNRKKYGKTLPFLLTSEGFLDPFDYDIN